MDQPQPEDQWAAPNLYDHKVLQGLAARHRANAIDDTDVEVSKLGDIVWALTLNVNWIAQLLADPDDGLPAATRRLRAISEILNDGNLG